MLALALGSGVIGFLAQSMFDYTFYNYRVMAVFFMVLGLGLALKHLKRLTKIALSTTFAWGNTYVRYREPQSGTVNNF